MIALTQEKREELAKFAKATLNSLNGIEPENPNQYDGCLSEYTQKCMEIALASLTAEKRATVDVVGVIWNEWKPEVGTPLFTDPPVPEIKLPEKFSEEVDDNFDYGKELGWNECLAEIKLLNGLGE